MEDFVTFEIAEKLKEKGFKQGYNIFGYKLIFSDENTIKYISEIGAYENEYFGINIPCPLISQVLEYLREEKKLHIIIPASFDGGFWWEVRDFNKEISEYSDIEYTSYKEATLAGIEYCLDKLI